MKTLSKLFLALMIISAMFGCNKDEDEVNPELAGLGKAKCFIQVNGKTVIDATSNHAGRDESEGDGRNIAVINLNNDGASFSISGIPVKVGSSVEIDGFDVGLLTSKIKVDGQKQTLYSETGTITRTSADKVSFNGLTKDKKHTITGYVQSDMIKQIN